MQLPRNISIAFSCNNSAFFRNIISSPRNIISFPRNIIARERKYFEGIKYFFSRERNTYFEVTKYRIIARERKITSKMTILLEHNSSPISRARKSIGKERNIGISRERNNISREHNIIARERNIILRERNNIYNIYVIYMTLQGLRITMITSSLNIGPDTWCIVLYNEGAGPLGHSHIQGPGNDFFLVGGGGEAKLLICLVIAKFRGGGTGISNPLRQKVGGGGQLLPCPPPAPTPLPTFIAIWLSTMMLWSVASCYWPV